MADKRARAEAAKFIREGRTDAETEYDKFLKGAKEAIKDEEKGHGADKEKGGEKGKGKDSGGGGDHGGGGGGDAHH